MLTFSLRPIVNGRCGCDDNECTQIGKHPAETWRTLDPERVPLEPTASQGVGIATGARSDIFVVDLDVKNAIDGVANFSALGPVPETYAVATPTGGFHLYFKHPGFVVRNSGPKSNPIAPGVDIRGDGGYVVAPGSPHRNGGRYAVHTDAPIAEAPAWLLAWPGLRHSGAELAEPAAEVEQCVASIPRDWRVMKAKQWVDQQPPAIENNGGDGHTFTVLTRAVHEWCLTDSDMIADAFVEWNSRCEPPWGGTQWAHKVKTALHKSTKPFDTLGVRVKYRSDTIGAIAASTEAPTPSNGVVTVDGLRFETGGLDAELPPIPYQVGTYIAKGEIVMLVAHGGNLKTWLAFSVAHAVASGRPWLGKFDTTRGRVGILDFESGKYEMKRRLKLLRVADNDVDDRLLRCSYPVIDLTLAESWVTLAKLKLDMLVLDSFAAANRGKDENSPEAADMLQHAGFFAEQTGCTVLAIHHARKGSGGDSRESVRGSTAIFAACDRIYMFDEPESEDGGIVRTTMRTNKAGAGRRPLDLNVELSDQGLRYVEGETKPKQEDEEKAATPEKNRELVIETLKKNPAGVSKEHLVNVMKGKRERKFELLSSMYLAGVTTEMKDRAENQTIVMLKNGFLP